MINDLIVQFAVLWGQTIGSATTPEEIERAEKMKQYDSEELLNIFSSWAEKYSDSNIEDSVEFFECMFYPFFTEKDEDEYNTDEIKTVECHLICCDTGVLLTQNDSLFQGYSIVYDHKYGYYDENQTAYKKEDLEKAIADARLYVNDGVDMTYAVISDQGICWCSEPFDSSETLGFTFAKEDVLYSIAKINGKIVENFIAIENNKEDHNE